MPKILFVNSDTEVEVAEGTTILEAALDNGIDIDNDCGANGVCGTCHVYIDCGIDRVSPKEGDEADLLETVDKLTDRSRLACQTRVLGDITVTIPK
ncbi:MAG: (2Fe-2S)-binding protein [candidate division Zixibacteria bacterium]|nr:(2Fe-2S)-binding protein [candidate division Zixibacteria bacterium]